MDKKKIINITEICLWILAVILIIIFINIKFMPKINSQKDKTIRQNGRIFIESVLADYDITKKSQYDIRRNVLGVIDRLNKERVNPYNKKNSPYVIDEECPGCLTINIDEGTRSIIMTGYDKKHNILTRAVINPPSYVSYEKPEK